MSKGYALSAGEGTVVPWADPDTRIVIKASGPTTDGKFTVIEDHSPAGAGVPTHVHHHDDEAFYILEGEYTVTCGEETFTAGPGSFVYLPAGVPHSQQIGDSAARKLIVCAPSGFDAFFIDMGKAFATGEMSLERRNTIAASHGITFVD